MKPSEFRLGNLITSDGEIFTVDEIHADYVNAGALGIYPAGFHDDYGIPLTEEWLERFGFKRNQSFHRYYHLGKYYRFDLKNDMLTVMLNPNSDVENEHEYHNIKAEYVHQLQNLYFSLTGTELTIKE